MGNILLRSVGTDGDVLPFLRIGGRLKARGHCVTLLSHCSYRSMAAQAGFRSIWTRGEREAAIPAENHWW